MCVPACENPWPEAAQSVWMARDYSALELSVSTIAYNCPQLQGFTAVGCTGIGFGAIRFLCKSCPLLHTLSVSGCHSEADPLPQADRADPDKLARSITANCPELRFLSLSRLRLEDTLEKLLKELPALEALDLSSLEQLPSERFHASLFEHAQDRLRSLKLAGCSRLLSISGHFTQLRTLYLGGCVRLNDAEGLGTLLQHCRRTLTLLSLVGCQNLSAEGLLRAFGHAGTLVSIQTLVLGDVVYMMNCVNSWAANAPASLPWTFGIVP